MRFCSWQTSSYLFPCVTSFRQVRILMVTQDNIHPMTRLFIFLPVRRAERPQDFLTLHFPFSRQLETQKWNSISMWSSKIKKLSLEISNMEGTHPVEFSPEMVAVPETYPLEFTFLLLILQYTLSSVFQDSCNCKKSMLTSNMFWLSVQPYLKCAARAYIFMYHYV